MSYTTVLMEAGTRESEVIVNDLTVSGLYQQLNTCLLALLEFGLGDEPVKISIKEWSSDD